MYAPLLWSLLGCFEDTDADGAGEPEPLVLTDEWPAFTPAGDAVYIRYDGVPRMVRATPAGVEALDLDGRTPLWSEATPDGRYLLVLTESDAGIEHVLVEDGAIVMAFADQDKNRIAASPDGRHLALWYDSSGFPNTDLFVDVTQITLVDTQAGAVTRIATGRSPRAVSLTDATALVVGATGALGLDLETQTELESYDFAEEGVAAGSWARGGVIAPGDAYAFVSSGDDDDDTVVRLGLRERSVLTASAPLSYEYDGELEERPCELLRVGDALFAYNTTRGLWTLDPDTFEFAPLDEEMRFSMAEMQADRAVLYGQEDTYILWTEPAISLHRDSVDTGTNEVWFGDDHAVVSRYEADTWHAKVIDLATGDARLQPLQDHLDWVALMTVGGDPVALLTINNVDTFALQPLAEEAALLPSNTEPLSPIWGAMANEEAFWVGGFDEAGAISFIDPVTLEQTVHRDFTALGLLEEP